MVCVVYRVLSLHNLRTYRDILVVDSHEALLNCDEFVFLSCLLQGWWLQWWLRWCCHC